MTTRREQGARRLVVVAGLAMVLASQVASGMPLERPEEQGSRILARSPVFNRQQLLGRFTPFNGDGSAIHKRQLNQDVFNIKDDAVVTVIAGASSFASAPASTSAVAATSVASATTSAVASTSVSLPAVTPVASASMLTLTSESTATSSGASTSTSTSSSTSSKGLFNVHNKLFPAVVAACVGIAVGVMLILITIGRCYAHAQMSPEEKAGEYGDAYKTSKNGGIAVRGAKSLRRAFTSKKLGSFARRNQEGTVLIDVGDEVYAVTAAVAQEYQRERSALGGSSGGSRLTSGPSNSANPLKQALKNAEMIVAASQVGEEKGRPTSRILVQSLRDQRGSDNIASQNRFSQKLTDGIRAFRGNSMNDKARPTASITHGSGAYSFDSEKQDMGSMRQAEVPPTAYLPVITRGAKEWDIRPRQQEINDYTQQNTLQSKSSSSSSSHSSSSLSHQRHTLTDGSMSGGPSQTQSQRHSQPRPKSILVKRDDQSKSATQKSVKHHHHNHRQQQRKPVPGLESGTVGVQRTKTIGHRKTNSSTSAASPKMLQQRTMAPLDSATAVYLKPAKPNSSAPEFINNAPQTRDLFRPLPGVPSR